MLIKASLVFVTALFLDGFMLPALFGFRESLLSFVTLIVFMLYTSPLKLNIAYGLFFSIISEVLKGISFGEITIPLLLTTCVIYLTHGFLDIKYIYSARFNLSKLFTFSFIATVFIYLFLFFYKLSGIIIFGDNIRLILDGHLLNTAIILAIAGESLLLAFLFNILFNKEGYYN
ncbi:MAG: hypothetical protein A3J46_02505 [Candidatus Yanofskybacteria bacterium RIFCSPHIGHO2_02_FULL_41_11]|uniref:Rod shape-determining protein MreD n=1 Tax=Candidatus Yanofskybacteria bacterium RIFCSPHIGHO2_02_FULL_41_11 TaxID=1802675 RepID=A0A1F8F6X3_9BACT|nr:MAG: hypothetical protein A3J46_02505 [Candidatus Yanofskybacteria bacterium RIFCSPHIGHO2_02_FULL_41_11]